MVIEIWQKNSNDEIYLGSCHEKINRDEYQQWKYNKDNITKKDEDKRVNHDMLPCKQKDKQQNHHMLSWSFRGNGDCRNDNYCVLYLLW